MTLGGPNSDPPAPAPSARRHCPARPAASTAPALIAGRVPPSAKANRTAAGRARSILRDCLSLPRRRGTNIPGRRSTSGRVDARLWRRMKRQPLRRGRAPRPLRRRLRMRNLAKVLVLSLAAAAFAAPAYAASMGGGWGGGGRRRDPAEGGGPPGGQRRRGSRPRRSRFRRRPCAALAGGPERQLHTAGHQPRPIGSAAGRSGARRWRRHHPWPGGPIFVPDGGLLLPTAATTITTRPTSITAGSIARPTTARGHFLGWVTSTLREASRTPEGRRAQPALRALAAGRTRQRDQRLDDGVVLVAAARQRLRRRRVEAAVADQRVVDMEGDDLAEHQIGVDRLRRARSSAARSRRPCTPAPRAPRRRAAP